VNSHLKKPRLTRKKREGKVRTAINRRDQLNLGNKHLLPAKKKGKSCFLRYGRLQGRMHA
jgi:hypothetical protein